MSVKSRPVAIEKDREVPWEELLRNSELLTRDFYESSAKQVARALLGKLLVCGNAAGRIVEVEAYLGREDRAAHAWRGVTDRTRVIFGPPGHAYVYFIYGMYECLNLVAEAEGRPGCVLFQNSVFAVPWERRLAAKQQARLAEHKAATDGPAAEPGQ